MKRLLTLALFAAMALVVVPAESQAKDMRLAVDGGGVMPIGDWSDMSGIGIGALLRYEYLMSPNLTITGRVGYIYGLGKSYGGMDVSTNEIPIMGGVRYYFQGYKSKKREGLYASGELGLISISINWEIDGCDGSSMAGAFGGCDYSGSTTELGGTAGIGYELPSGIDVNASAFLPSLGDMFGILVTVGYSFYAF